MNNPLRRKSTIEKTVEDPPRALKSGLAAIGIFAAIFLVSAIVSRARNGHEEESE